MATPNTSHSLLERARDPGDGTSWRRLTDLYAPLIRRWVRPYVASRPTPTTCVQDVLAILVREIPGFEHNGRTGAFRAWLQSTTVNRLRVHWRPARPAAGGDGILGQLHQLEDPTSLLSRAWDEDHDRHVAQTLCRVDPPGVPAGDLARLRGHRPRRRSTADVAEELGISVNAVLIAKSRVLKRLRQKAEGLID